MEIDTQLLLFITSMDQISSGGCLGEMVIIIKDLPRHVVEYTHGCNASRNIEVDAYALGVKTITAGVHGVHMICHTHCVQ